jgi:hypothetical protein
MPSLLSSRRAAAGVTLRVTPARKKDVQATRLRRKSAPISWHSVAVLGGAVAALTSWILCVGVTITGWLAADSGSLSEAVRVGTRLWLLSNGVGVRIGAIPVTLVPWGLTALIAFIDLPIRRGERSSSPEGPGKGCCSDQRRDGWGLLAARACGGSNAR